MKNQGGETKAAPQPAGSTKTTSGLGLEEGDAPEAAAPLEGAVLLSPYEGGLLYPALSLV